MRQLLTPPLAAVALFAGLTFSGDHPRAVAQDVKEQSIKEGLAREWTLQEWEVEAGSAYFGDTAIGVKRGVSEAASTAAARGSTSYMRKR
jgi:hypothetical protein